MNLKQLYIFGMENSQEPVIKNPILRAALEGPSITAQEPRTLVAELTNMNTPDLEQTEVLRPGETLEDWKPNPFLKPHAEGGRIGFADGLTVKQQQKVIDAFGKEMQLEFIPGKTYGVQKYYQGDRITVNPEWTKIDRFIKKGFTTEMGEGLNVRGEKYSKRGKRLSIEDQNKIRAKYDLPEGVKEWDFKTHKYGIKQEGREKLLKRMAKTVGDKNPWTLATDFGSTKGWMMAQMERVYKNERKNPHIKKLTYKPIYAEINGVDRIVGFKDNTKAGGGKTYYGTKKYMKKNAGNWTKHGDWKLNQKLVDISKRSMNAPNEVITGLLKKKGFTGKTSLNDLIHYLSGTEGTSQAVIKNAIVKHHQSGVQFGSATDDLALTTKVINQKINKIEQRIRANNILADDIQTLKNNNVYVRHNNKLYGSGSKSAIGQFKQIEKGVETEIRTGKKFKNIKDFKNFINQMDRGKATLIANSLNEGKFKKPICIKKSKEVCGVDFAREYPNEYLRKVGAMEEVGKFFKSAKALNIAKGVLNTAKYWTSPMTLGGGEVIYSSLAGWNERTKGASWNESINEAMWFFPGKKARDESEMVGFKGHGYMPFFSTERHRLDATPEQKEMFKTMDLARNIETQKKLENRYYTKTAQIAEIEEDIKKGTVLPDDVHRLAMLKKQLDLTKTEFERIAAEGEEMFEEYKTGRQEAEGTTSLSEEQLYKPFKNVQAQAEQFIVDKYNKSLEEKYTQADVSPGTGKVWSKTKSIFGMGPDLLGIRSWLGLGKTRKEEKKIDKMLEDDFEGRKDLYRYNVGARGLGYLRGPEDLTRQQWELALQKNPELQYVIPMRGVNYRAGGLANLTRTVAPDSEGIMSLKKK